MRITLAVVGRTRAPYLTRYAHFVPRLLDDL